MFVYARSGGSGEDDDHTNGDIDSGSNSGRTQRMDADINSQV